MEKEERKGQRVKRPKGRIGSQKGKETAKSPLARVALWTQD